MFSMISHWLGLSIRFVPHHSEQVLSLHFFQKPSIKDSLSWTQRYATKLNGRSKILIKRSTSKMTQIYFYFGENFLSECCPILSCHDSRWNQITGLYGCFLDLILFSESFSFFFSTSLQVLWGVQWEIIVGDVLWIWLRLCRFYLNQ